MTALAVAELAFRTKLTPELTEELCLVHKRDRDFRNITALRCQVSPMRLKTWLITGARHVEEETVSIYAQLALRFAIIEAEIRADNIREVLNPVLLTEETEYNEAGVPISSKKIKRDVRGTQWYMERRWRQYRADSQPTELDSEMAAITSGQTSAGLSIEQALQICRQLAREMHVNPTMRPLLEIFVAEQWGVPPLTA